MSLPSISSRFLHLPSVLHRIILDFSADSVETLLNIGATCKLLKQEVEPMLRCDYCNQNIPFLLSNPGSAIICGAFCKNTYCKDCKHEVAYFQKFYRRRRLDHPYQYISAKTRCSSCASTTDGKLPDKLAQFLMIRRTRQLNEEETQDGEAGVNQTNTRRVESSVSFLDPFNQFRPSRPILLNYDDMHDFSHSRVTCKEVDNVPGAFVLRIPTNNGREAINGGHGSGEDDEDH